MKTSRVHQPLVGPNQAQLQYPEKVGTSRTPTRKTRMQRSVFSSASQNDGPEYPLQTPRKSSGILNKIGPTTSASDIITMMNSQHELDIQSIVQPKLLRTPFYLGYIPPKGTQFPQDINHNSARPITAIGPKQRQEQQQLKDVNSTNTSTMAGYQKFFQYGNILTNLGTKYQPLKQDSDNTIPISTPGDYVAPRHIKKKTKGKKPPPTAPEKEPEKLETHDPICAKCHVSKSECSVNPLKPSCTQTPLQHQDIRRLPDWLIQAATTDLTLEKLRQARRINNLSYPPTMSKPKPKPKSPVDNMDVHRYLEERARIISTVKLVTPKASRVSMMKRTKPNTFFQSAEYKPSNSSLSSEDAANLEMEMNKTPRSYSAKLEEGTKLSPKDTTIASRSKIKPPVRKSVPKKVDARVFEGSAVSKAIRSGVAHIKDIAVPQRVKRIPDLPVPVKVKSTTESRSMLSLNDKGKDTSKGKITPRKTVKAKAKKSVTKRSSVSSKFNTPTDDFLGSQHHMIDLQLRNLWNRQKSLEREVLILFEGLQNSFCSDECCCSKDTQEKMMTLIQKQKEVIQLQIDLRKRYGFNLGSSVNVGPNEPILDGFNAHFGQLAAYAREIDGEMVYYCSVCNAACDNELAFRKHLESTKHVLQTCQGIQRTQPIYTCDDCEVQMQGTTEYMSHVINKKDHNAKPPMSPKTSRE